MNLNQWINPKYIKNINKLKKSFDKRPFPHHFLSNFLIREKINNLLKEIKKEKFKEKNTDLFQLYQTQDLKHSDSKTIQKFSKFVSSREFISYIEKVTDTKLSNQVDISSLKLKKTNYLLCHDDQLANRKIAFIFYLKTLKKSDGGSLDFFDSKPNRIIKSFYPKHNSLMLFKVSNKSLHQICEVISNKERITIGGWFHD